MEERGYLPQTAHVTNRNTENSNVETDIQTDKLKIPLQSQII